ncbi:DNA repair protein Rad4 family [Abeliophyllum distichum]|uniref:DNA repair protein Rad4 family n=1 Tax=Abeliophyllum distichum TaxID=126358 RepID=A0ABD1SF47_9LAMI
MRTRNQSKRPHQSTGEQEAMNHHHESENIDDNETLANVSRDAVGKLLKRVKRGFNKEDTSYLCRCDSVAKPEREQKGNDNQSTVTAASRDTIETESCSRDAMDNAPSEVKVEEGRSQPEKEDEFDDPDWEDGSIPASHSTENNREELINGVTVEFDVSPGSAKQKAVRRATAQEKEVAELVHKAHLLCLLGRGRLIDSACNDTLIQASLLSLLPTDLLKIADLPKLTATHLTPVVRWFHNNFHVRSPSGTERSCHLVLASTLENREGSPEEVAALSVALFRALNLTTRFVSILDVTSLKPDADKFASTNNDVSKGGKSIFNSSTLMVAGPSCSFASTAKSLSFDDMQMGSQTPARGCGETVADKSMKLESESQDIFVTDKSTDGKSEPFFSEDQTAASDPHLMESEGLKRKGDLEFEMQLKMALSATAIGSSKSTMDPSVVDSPSSSSTITPPFKRKKKIMIEGSPSSSNGISTSIGSKKEGAPLYWAEVFCSGENLTGKWVHVDAVNAIIDGEQKVEAAAAACKKTLRYVVAFAGHGAKDVTRRYCTKWYKIASQRINSTWWDGVLAPLKELESGATSGVINLEQEASVDEEMEALQGADHPDGECLLKTKQLCGASEECREKALMPSMKKNSVEATRSSLEDMELETRALTEPLPTNQQAYKNHHLYAIERWLKKYEIMYPKGPVLGFCSGHPVYPRTCVVTLHTKERWLREGRQVKADELPAKVLKRKRSKQQAHEDDEYSEVDREGIVSLYGKWQTETLCLPRAINGIVPKNERGRVDVWSEKCLPPGTVHLRLPRVALVAKRLDIDYAPAMVGFEFRNGQSFPVVEGIVVCAEFKDAILEAYAEEEERRAAEEKRRNESQALSRWYQLLSSIITRQMLNNCYRDGDSSQPSIDIPIPDNKSCIPHSRTKQKNVSPRCHQVNTPDEKRDAPSIPTQNHEHEFTIDDQAFDEESSTRVKKCWCGFSIQFEEL